jgi:peroxiredoxin
MAAETPVCDFGWKAPPFLLPDLEGRLVSFADIVGTQGTLVMFLCNHCPYVRAIEDRIARDVDELAALGIGAVAICANDAVEYPEDGREGLADQSRRARFHFPYLIDEDQSVARAWGAACTPDFFGLNTDGALQYRGRLDASGRNPGPPDAGRELFEAMRRIARTGEGPREQIASMGCSIKWKAA